LVVITSLGFAPASAHIELFDSTWQLLAVMLPVPLSEIPLPLPLSAMMQPGALALISTEATALTGIDVLVVSTLARCSGTLLDTVTFTAELPSPVGELATEALADVVLVVTALSDAMLLTAELADVAEPVEL
jgi:hypothetical protein